MDNFCSGIILPRLQSQNGCHLNVISVRVCFRFISLNDLTIAANGINLFDVTKDNLSESEYYTPYFSIKKRCQFETYYESL